MANIEENSNAIEKDNDSGSKEIDDWYKDAILNNQKDIKSN